MLSRRTLVSSIPGIAAAGLLAACTKTTGNGVTTITLNVNAMNSWGQAIVNGAELVGGLPGIVGTPAGLAVMALAPVISADMAAFVGATGGSMTFTFDTTSPATVVTSIANDAQKLLAAVVAAIPQVPANIAASANEYLAAIKTIVSTIQAAIAVTAGAAPSDMSVAKAMAVLSK
jgi:hypothetical protein